MSTSYRISAVIMLLVALLFGACNKENIDQTITEVPNYEPTVTSENSLINAMEGSDAAGKDLACLVVNYPFDLLLASDAIITVSNASEFQLAMEAEAGDAVKDFIFPLSVTKKDATITEVSSNQELSYLYAACVPTDTWDFTVVNGDVIPAFLFEGYCFELVYPVNLEDEAGNSYTANDEGELVDLCVTIDPLFFVLPITVINEDGEEVEIADQDAFFQAYFDCTGTTPPVVSGEFIIQGFGCNELVYPYNVVDTEGNVTTINDVNEYADLLLNGTPILLEYPFTLTNPDGDLIEVTDGDALIDALNECDGIYIEITPNDDCGFTPAHVLILFNQSFCGGITFPFQLEVGGSTIDVADMDAYFDVFNANPMDEIFFVYPITVTQPDGTVVTLNDDDEVCTFITDCE